VRIVADQNIPCVAEAFRDLGEVRLMPGREIKAQHLRDCQCLITRTVTRIDAALLEHSAVEFVGTATIVTSISTTCNRRASAAAMPPAVTPKRPPNT
jgi:erythronate-4-phosphate dehydrogenase